MLEKHYFRAPKQVFEQAGFSRLFRAAKHQTSGFPRLYFSQLDDFKPERENRFVSGNIDVGIQYG